jgi:hypothetical protein
MGLSEQARSAERFWSKVDRSGDCWPFDGTGRPDGYRQFGVGSLTDGTRRNVLAHRFAYELAVGPIPDGQQVDHECHNRDKRCLGGPSCSHRACVRPEHLVARTGRSNVLRSRAAPAVNLVKTHCPVGHPYDEANTYINSKGHRGCRTCGRERARQYRAANPEKVREANRRAEQRRSEKQAKERSRTQ